METKGDMNIYHKMLDGKCIMLETTEKTIELNKKYIAFLEKQINIRKELIESIKTFVEKLKYFFFFIMVQL